MESLESDTSWNIEKKIDFFIGGFFFYFCWKTKNEIKFRKNVNVDCDSL